MNVVIKVSSATKEKMIEYFKDKINEKKPPYAVFQAKEEDTIVTLYESGKVMFQGVSADVDANMWKEMDLQTNEKENDYYYTNAIGSDEVGTGDYYGPIVITSTYVNKNDISFLEELGLKDSKQMNDNQILKIVPTIIKHIKYSSVILTNKEYNEKYSKDVNMNKIKAILHNKVLSNMLSNNVQYDYIIVDQFVDSKNYYKYLVNIPNIVRNITFLTKAENKNLSVACASVISRYIFLKELDKLSEKLNIILPKGANNQVDEVGKKIVQQYNIEKLKDVAKFNFKNTAKILKDN